MNSRSAEIYNQLVCPTGKVGRLTDLLKNPSRDHEDGWAIHVPPSHNEALDIKQTNRVIDGNNELVWTQGSSFFFKEGDTLYDQPVKDVTWRETLRTLSLCIQVEEGLSAGIIDQEGKRSPGYVKFCILTPNKAQNRLIKRKVVTMTQDEFVDFLHLGTASKDLTIKECADD